MINIFSKVGYKTNIQKSAALLHISNEQAVKEIRKIILFTVVLRETNKQNPLGINLIKEVKDLYNEHYKSLKRETEEDTKRWNDLPYSWTGRINLHINLCRLYTKQSTDSM
jgi:hypothetical protein